MRERLTSFGRERLEEKISRSKEVLAKRKLEYGEAANFRDGDGYHDETVNTLEAEVRKATTALNALLGVFTFSEELKQPEQFERVELGHRVGIEYVDEEIPPQEVFVTILSSAEAMVLSETELFDQEVEIVVSSASPLGGALLGKRVGEKIQQRIGDEGGGVVVKSIGVAFLFQQNFELTKTENNRE